MGRRLSFASIAVAIASLFAVMYFVTAIPRLFYPYDLDFIEDSMLMQSLRFAQGQPVYIAPSIEFVPHVYMPLYSWLGGLLFRVFGVSYVPLRLLSFAATLTTAGLILYIAWREGRERWLAFVCAGLFLGGYRITGFWYELARVDSLFVALSLAGMVLGLYVGPDGSVKVWRLLISAAILTLAFFTKQTALAFIAYVIGYLSFTVRRADWWRGLLFFASLVGWITLSLVALNSVTGGWFYYHVFAIAAADEVEFGRVMRYLGLELFGLMLSLSAMVVIAGMMSWHRVGRIGGRGAGVIVLRSQPWLLAIGAAAVISGAGRASVGGNVNNLMSVYALLCIAPALLWKEMNSPLPAGEGPGVKVKLQLIIILAILFQFAFGAYNPLRYIPTREMREAGDRLIARIEAVDGPVLVMMHPYYAWLAGKEPSAQIAEIWYLHAWSGVPLPQDFVDRIRKQYYAAIVSSESMFETDPEIEGLIDQYYTRAGAVDAPPTMTGMIVRPSVIYRPK